MKTPAIKNMLEYEKAEARAKEDIKKEYEIVLNTNDIKILRIPQQFTPEALERARKGIFGDS